METLILSPSWVLTMNHAASSYGAPVLVNRDTGEAFGAGDVLGAYPGWSGLPAGTVVTRLAQGKEWSEKEVEFINRFVRFME